MSRVMRRVTATHRSCPGSCRSSWREKEERGGGRAGGAAEKGYRKEKDERERHSPFGSVQEVLRGSPHGGVDVGVRERADEGVRGGVQDITRGGVEDGVRGGVREGVEEGVRIPRLGVSGDVPALAQQAEGDEEEEGEGTHGNDLVHL